MCGACGKVYDGCGRAKPQASGERAEGVGAVVDRGRLNDYRGGGSRDIGPGASAMLSEESEDSGAGAT